MGTADRKCIIPTSVVASTDPPFVCWVKTKTHKTRFFSSAEDEVMK